MQPICDCGVSTGCLTNHHTATMKIPRYLVTTMLATAVLSGFLLHPLRLAAQDVDTRPGAPVPPPPPAQLERGAVRDGGAVMRPQLIMRQLVELLRAGKYDEARQLAERISAAAKDNPQVAALIERAKGNRHPQTDERKLAEPAAAGPPLRMKIQHLREAADHLNAAGYEKMANLARVEIQRIEADAKHQEAEVRRDAGQETNPSMKAELDNLRREIEELRNQLRHLKADGTPKPAPERPSPPTE